MQCYNHTSHFGPVCTVAIIIIHPALPANEHTHTHTCTHSRLILIFIPSCLIYTHRYADGLNWKSLKRMLCSAALVMWMTGCQWKASGWMAERHGAKEKQTERVANVNVFVMLNIKFWCFRMYAIVIVAECERTPDCFEFHWKFFSALRVMVLWAIRVCCCCSVVCDLNRTK